MKAAYADPPYLGLAKAFYGEMHPEAGEYDKPETHQRLIDRLMDEYDCWAMSLHEPALREILNMCPKDVRVAAWVKPFAAFKKNVTRAWTWEPDKFCFWIFEGLNLQPEDEFHDLFHGSGPNSMRWRPANTSPTPSAA